MLCDTFGDLQLVIRHDGRRGADACQIAPMRDKAGGVL